MATVLNLDFKTFKTSSFVVVLPLLPVIAIILVFNDVIDAYLEQMPFFHKDKHPYIKGCVHAVNIFTIYMIVSYVFYYTFGWGRGYN